MKEATEQGSFIGVCISKDLHNFIQGDRYAFNKRNGRLTTMNKYDDFKVVSFVFFESNFKKV